MLFFQGVYVCFGPVSHSYISLTRIDVTRYERDAIYQRTLILVPIVSPFLLSMRFTTSKQTNESPCIRKADNVSIVTGTENSSGPFHHICCHIHHFTTSNFALSSVLLSDCYRHWIVVQQWYGKIRTNGTLLFPCGNLSMELLDSLAPPIMNRSPGLMIEVNRIGLGHAVFLASFSSLHFCTLPPM